MNKEELVLKIQSLMLTRNFSDAYKLFTKYHDQYFEDPKFRLLGAKVLAGIYHYDEAIRMLEGLLEDKDIDKFAVLREMGLIQENNGSIDKAIATYRRLIEISPKEQYFAKVHIAKIEFKRGNAKAAIDTLKSIERNDGGKRDLQLAKIYRAVGLNNEAKELLEHITIDKRDLSSKNKCYLQRAYLAMDEENYAEVFRNLRSIKSSNEKILLEKRVLMYQVFYKTGDMESARKAVVNEFKDRSHFRWLTAAVVGDMDFYEKKYDIARIHYQMAINNSSDYYHKLGLLLKLMRVEFRSGKFGAARAYYDKVIKDEIFGKEANYAMIEECLSIGDSETAKAYYEKLTPEQISLDNEKYQKYGKLLDNSLVDNNSLDSAADKVLSHSVRYSTLTKEKVVEELKTLGSKITEDNRVGTSGLYDEYIVGGYPTIGYDDDWNEYTAFRVKTIIGTKEVVDMIPRVGLDNIFTTKEASLDVWKK